MATILVIEDEESVRSNILELLEAEDFHAIGAENGFNGVIKARDYKPNLIICDVMMPELDGYGVLHLLREDPATATIPFIFLTAKADRVDLRKGMELGADDYLTKPFTKNEFLGAIATRLEKQATIAQQSDQKLEELRRSITEAMPQQLLNPLEEIFTYSRSLVDDYDSVKPYEILETAQNINTSAVRLHRLIENFIMYAQIEAFAKNSEQVQALKNCLTLNPNELLFEISTQKAKLISRENDLGLEIENAILKIAKEDFKKVIEELIDNAFKFSESGSPVEVKASIENDMWNLDITNYGGRMTAAQIASIGACMQFDRSFYEQPGLGLGLIIAKRITEVYGGQLTIDAHNSQITVRVALHCEHTISTRDLI